MLYNKKPKDYITQVEVAGCIIECQGKILLMKRSNNSNCPGFWQQPGGKLDAGEENEQAMIRETFEESGIQLIEGQAERLFKKYFYFTNLNIAITFYKVELEMIPNITLAVNEHSEYVWVTPKQALRYDLIEDFNLILKEVYKL